MPPRTTAAAAAAGEAGTKSRGTRAPRAKAAPAAQAEQIQTFAEFTATRPFPVVGENDEKLNTRTFVLPIGVVERTRATAAGIQHRVYETDLEGRAPDSISAGVTEALDAWCTYYENLLNNGEPFRRVHKLPPGPGRAGAERGAQRRSDTAAAKRAAKAAKD